MRPKGSSTGQTKLPMNDFLWTAQVPHHFTSFCLPWLCTILWSIITASVETLVTRLSGPPWVIFLSGHSAQDISMFYRNIHSWVLNPKLSCVTPDSSSSLKSIFVTSSSQFSSTISTRFSQGYRSSMLPSNKIRCLPSGKAHSFIHSTSISCIRCLQCTGTASWNNKYPDLLELKL